MTEFLQFSLVPILMGVLAGIACALPGNFLLLQRRSLVGDAVSHVVLPGIVAGFLVSGGTSPAWMLAGAAGAAVLAAVAFEAVRRAARVEAGAAMGAVFTAMFALGVLMLEQSDARTVHLDVEHALYGNLESHIWLAATDWGALLDTNALAALPRDLALLGAVAGCAALLTWAFFRELRIVTFDPEFATAIGLPARTIGFAIVIAAAFAAVAAFSAVGSIIVIAMFVCPPAAARLLTNSLSRQIWLSVAIAAFSAIAGFILAGHVPGWLGFATSLNAAGMIAVVSGLCVLAAALLGPDRSARNRNA